MKPLKELKYEIIYAMYQAQLPLSDIEKIIVLNRYESIVFARVESVRMRNLTMDPMLLRVSSAMKRTPVCSKMFEYKSIVTEHDSEDVKKEIKKICKCMLKMFNTEKACVRADLNELTGIVRHCYSIPFIREQEYARKEAQRAVQCYPNVMPQGNLDPLGLSIMPYNGGINRYQYSYCQAQAMQDYQRRLLDIQNAQETKAENAKEDSIPPVENVEDDNPAPTESWMTSKEIAGSMKSDDYVISKKKEKKEEKKHVAPVDKQLPPVPAPTTFVSTVHYYFSKLKWRIDSMAKFKEVVASSFTELNVFTSYAAHQTKMSILSVFGAEEAEKLIHENNLQNDGENRRAIFVASWVDGCGDIHDVNKWILPITVADPNGSHVEWYMVKYDNKMHTYIATSLQIVK